MNETERKKRAAEAQRQYKDKDRDAHNTKRRAYMKEYREQPENVEKLRKYHREYRRRTGCQKRYDAAHPEWYQHHKKQRREKAAEERAAVIAEYGGRCEVCGITELEYLTVDHRFMDGAQHRRATHGKIYHDIVKNGFPKDKGYRVLCYNHNCSNKGAAVKE